METFEPINTNEPAKRPVFLSVLCILTFISTGFAILAFLFSLASGPVSQDQLEKEVAQGMVAVNQMRDMDADYLADQMEKIYHTIEYTNKAHYAVLAVNFVAIVLGFGGTVLMWRGRKIGFHSYILYNIVSILSIYVAVPASQVPTIVVISGVIFSMLFIFMYSRNLHWLK